MIYRHYVIDLVEQADSELVVQLLTKKLLKIMAENQDS